MAGYAILAPSIGGINIAASSVSIIKFTVLHGQEHRDLGARVDQGRAARSRELKTAITPLARSATPAQLPMTSRDAAVWPESDPPLGLLRQRARRLHARADRTGKLARLRTGCMCKRPSGLYISTRISHDRSRAQKSLQVDRACGRMRLFLLRSGRLDGNGSTHLKPGAQQHRLLLADTSR
jgi:hypothetical protein